MHTRRQKNRGYSHTNLYSDIKYDVMIAILSLSLSLLALHSLKRSRKKEKRTNWAGHHAICIGYERRVRDGKKYKPRHSFPPFVYFLQLLGGKQTYALVEMMTIDLSFSIDNQRNI
jgi:hypothetical protein